MSSPHFFINNYKTTQICNTCLHLNADSYKQSGKNGCKPNQRKEPANGKFNWWRQWRIRMSAMKQMQEKMFKAMDSNGDGKVDKNEMSAFQKAQQADGKQGGPSVDEIFKKSDSNSDGGITLQEMQDSMAKIAQQMSEPSLHLKIRLKHRQHFLGQLNIKHIQYRLVIKNPRHRPADPGNTTDADPALTALEKLASSNSADSSSTSTSSTSSTDNPFLKDLRSIRQ